MNTLDAVADFPPCARQMLTRGIRGDGREVLFFKLCLHFKARSFSKEEALDLLLFVNSNAVYPALAEEVVERELKKAYARDEDFGCGTALLSDYCDKTCDLYPGDTSDAGQLMVSFKDVEKGEYKFKHGTCLFELSGFAIFRGSGRASVTLSRGGELVHRDMLSFASSPQRQRYVAAATKAGVNGLNVNQDLIDIESIVLEMRRRTAMMSMLEEKKKYALTPGEEQAAKEWLSHNPFLLETILSLVSRFGVVGEERSILLIYLLLTSRLLPTPVSAITKGESSTGKSHVIGQVLKIFPDSEVLTFTRSTGAALYHGAPDEYRYKVLYFAEAAGMNEEQANLAVRSLQSEASLSLRISVKDPNTGAWQAETKKVQGPCAVITTTTESMLYKDNETRCFSIYSNDSEEQTSDVLSHIGLKAADKLLPPPTKEEVQPVSNAQLLLTTHRGQKVVVPFANRITDVLPCESARIRRDAERFLNLICASAMIHRYHRKSENKVLFANLADYYIAKEIGRQALFQSLHELGPQAERLFQWVEGQIVLKNEGEKPIMDFSNYESFKEDWIVTYDEIAEGLNVSKRWIQTWIKQLYHSEHLINLARGKKGRSARITLGPKSFVEEVTLPPVRELMDAYPCDEELIYSPLGLEVDLDK